MKPAEMLSKMLVLATNKHAGHYDRGGRPYILHPLKVMHLLRSDDDELNSIALGHDLIEDTDTTYSELRSLGFSDRVINGIAALTKVKGETFEDYKIKVCNNQDAIRVKMADLQHNTDIRRLKGLTQKDFERTARYHEFYSELRGLRCQSRPH